MAGLQMSMQIMLDYAERIELSVCRHRGLAFAVIETDGGHVTISGPADRVAAMLRELADKVDAETGQVVA